MVNVIYQYKLNNKKYDRHTFDHRWNIGSTVAPGVYIQNRRRSHSHIARHRLNCGGYKIPALGILYNLINSRFYSRLFICFFSVSNQAMDRLIIIKRKINY